VGSRLLAQQQENMTEEMVPNSWVIFAAHDCPDCETLKQQFLPELQAEYGLILPPVFLVYIDAPEGYALLTEVETMLGIRCDTFPALLAGHEMYGGINNIRAAREQLAMAVLSETPLGELLPLLQANVDLCLPLSTPARASGSPAGTSTSQEVPTDYRNADILYFAAEGCRECGRTEVMLDYAQTLFPDRKIARVSVLAKEGRLLQMAVAARLGVPHSMNTAVPMIVSGTEVIYGGNITDSEIQQLLHTAPASPFWRDWDEEAEFQAASTRITRMARQFTWLGVLAAGLADGINPCAFAVIVFFVSYLMLARNLSRWEALFQGGMFCLGVFLCYLLIGIGLTGVLHFIGKFPGLRYGIFLGMAVFAFACAAAAFYDALRAKRLNPAAMRFGMPKKASALAHRLIREHFRRGLLATGALVLGFAVSSLELVCTGQIYLPVLAVINSGNHSSRYLLMLLAYNLAFIAPLVAVLLLATFGVRTERLTAWGRRHAVLTRTMIGLLLLLIGLALLALA
jgi:cytochrome c biogenesis protein CcdA